MKTKTVFLFLLACFALSAGENMLENAGFEEVENGKFSKWICSADDRESLSADEKIRHSGKSSLRIRKGRAFQKRRPVADFNRDIIIRGWARYEGIARICPDGTPARMPFVGIWCYCKGKNSFTINVLPVAPGDREWFRFERRITAADFQRKIEGKRTEVRPDSWGFRINVSKQPGILWLDDLEMVFAEPDNFRVSIDRDSVSGKDNAILSIECGEPAAVTVFNAGGKQVFSRKTAPGKNSVCLLFSSYSEGNYTVKVTSGNHSRSFNVVKVADAFDE